MEQLSFFSIEKKIQNAITLLKMFEAKAIEMHPEGYYLCFSGGKDSQVIYELAKQAKVKFQAYYNVTTVDPPELVYFIRKMYPAVIINQPDTTMWELISQKHYPPTRRMRYCCSELKERGGKGRFVVTGVRWAESRKRRKRGFAEIQGPSEPKVILNSDNDEKRRQIENCQIKGKRVLNPILDWTDDEVWQFIHTHIRTYCSLYDEGFTRIGCIGCPLASTKQREKELARYPMFKKAYLKAFDRMLSYHKEGTHGSATWKDAEDVYRWWLYGNPPKEIQVTGQIRKSEISGIKYTDIDYENRTLKIERQLGRSLEVDENEIAPKTRTKQEIDVKTPASNRVEKIPNFLFSEILEERKKYEKNRSRRQHGRWVFQDMDYICCSSYGRPRSTTYIYTHYKKLIEEAGLPYIRFHDLRHTYTTLLMKNDINQKAIAASLGHSKSIITFDVYTDKQALIEGGVEEIDAFIDEVHPYDSEDIQILKEKYGKKVLHRLA